MAGGSVQRAARQSRGRGGGGRAGGGNSGNADSSSGSLGDRAGCTDTEEERFWIEKDTEFFSAINPRLLALLHHHKHSSEAFLDAVLPYLRARSGAGAEDCAASAASTSGNEAKAHSVSLKVPVGEFVLQSWRGADASTPVPSRGDGACADAARGGNEGAGQSGDARSDGHAGRHPPSWPCRRRSTGEGKADSSSASSPSPPPHCASAGAVERRSQQLSEDAPSRADSAAPSWASTGPTTASQPVGPSEGEEAAAGRAASASRFFRSSCAVSGASPTDGDSPDDEQSASRRRAAPESASSACREGEEAMSSPASTACPAQTRAGLCARPPRKLVLERPSYSGETGKIVRHMWPANLLAELPASSLSPPPPLGQRQRPPSPCRQTACEDLRKAAAQAARLQRLQDRAAERRRRQEAEASRVHSEARSAADETDVRAAAPDATSPLSAGVPDQTARRREDAADATSSGGRAAERRGDEAREARRPEESAEEEAGSARNGKAEGSEQLERDKHPASAKDGEARESSSPVKRERTDSGQDGEIKAPGSAAPDASAPATSPSAAAPGGGQLVSAPYLESGACDDGYEGVADPEDTEETHDATAVEREREAGEELKRRGEGGGDETSATLSKPTAGDARDAARVGAETRHSTADGCQASSVKREADEKDDAANAARSASASPAGGYCPSSPNGQDCGDRASPRRSTSGEKRASSSQWKREEEEELFYLQMNRSRSIFSLLPGANDPSLLNSLHHRQLETHVRHQSRDLAMFSPSRDRSRHRAASAPRPSPAGRSTARLGRRGSCADEGNGRAGQSTPASPWFSSSAPSSPRKRGCGGVRARERERPRDAAGRPLRTSSLPETDVPVRRERSSHDRHDLRRGKDGRFAPLDDRRGSREASSAHGGGAGVAARDAAGARAAGREREVVQRMGSPLPGEVKRACLLDGGDDDQGEAGAAADGDFFVPTVNKKWNGSSRLPAFPTCRPPDAFVLSMLIPPNVRPSDFPADANAHGDVSAFLAVVMEAATTTAADWGVHAGFAPSTDAGALTEEEDREEGDGGVKMRDGQRKYAGDSDATLRSGPQSRVRGAGVASATGACAQQDAAAGVDAEDTTRVKEEGEASGGARGAGGGESEARPLTGQEEADGSAERLEVAGAGGGMRTVGGHGGRRRRRSSSASSCGGERKRGRSREERRKRTAGCAPPGSLPPRSSSGRFVRRDSQEAVQDDTASSRSSSPLSASSSCASSSSAAGCSSSATLLTSPRKRPRRRLPLPTILSGPVPAWIDCRDAPPAAWQEPQRQAAEQAAFLALNREPSTSGGGDVGGLLRRGTRPETQRTGPAACCCSPYSSPLPPSSAAPLPACASPPVGVGLTFVPSPQPALAAMPGSFGSPGHAQPPFPPPASCPQYTPAPYPQPSSCSPALPSGGPFIPAPSLPPFPPCAPPPIGHPPGLSMSCCSPPSQAFPSGYPPAGPCASPEPFSSPGPCPAVVPSPSSGGALAEAPLLHCVRAPAVDAAACASGVSSAETKRSSSSPPAGRASSPSSLPPAAPGFFGAPPGCPPVALSNSSVGACPRLPFPSFPASAPAPPGFPVLPSFPPSPFATYPPLLSPGPGAGPGDRVSGFPASSPFCPSSSSLASSLFPSPSPPIFPGLAAPFVPATRCASFLPFGGGIQKPETPSAPESCLPEPPPEVLVPPFFGASSSLKPFPPACCLYPAEIAESFRYSEKKQAMVPSGVRLELLRAQMTRVDSLHTFYANVDTGKRFFGERTFFEIAEENARRHDTGMQPLSFSSFPSPNTPTSPFFSPLAPPPGPSRAPSPSQGDTPKAGRKASTAKAARRGKEREERRKRAVEEERGRRDLEEKIKIHMHCRHLRIWTPGPACAHLSGAHRDLLLFCEEGAQSLPSPSKAHEGQATSAVAPPGFADEPRGPDSLPAPSSASVGARPSTPSAGDANCPTELSSGAQETAGRTDAPAATGGEANVTVAGDPSPPRELAFERSTDEPKQETGGRARPAAVARQGAATAEKGTPNAPGDGQEAAVAADAAVCEARADATPAGTADGVARKGETPDEMAPEGQREETGDERASGGNVECRMDNDEREENEGSDNLAARAKDALGMPNGGLHVKQNAGPEAAMEDGDLQEAGGRRSPHAAKEEGAQDAGSLSSSSQAGETADGSTIDRKELARQTALSGSPAAAAETTAVVPRANAVGAEVENLLWRFAALMDEKRAMCSRLLTSIQREKRPDWRAWAEVEDRMLRLYIEQSARSSLDTRHTYTLTQQSRDILRLRISCTSSGRLPPEWAERALCTVCGSGEDWDEDPIMFCDGCYQPVHFLCLGHRAVSSYEDFVKASTSRRQRRVAQAGGDNGLAPATARERGGGAKRDKKKAGANEKKERNNSRASQPTPAHRDLSGGGGGDAFGAPTGALGGAGAGCANGGGPRGDASGEGTSLDDGRASASAQSHAEGGAGGAKAGDAAAHTRRPLCGAGGFAFREDEEEWLCPVCEWLRKQLPQLDDELALAAIRLAAGPRSQDEAAECRASYVGWHFERLERFDSWVRPQLLALQYGDGRRRRAGKGRAHADAGGASGHGRKDHRPHHRRNDRGGGGAHCGDRAGANGSAGDQDGLTTLSPDAAYSVQELLAWPAVRVVADGGAGAYHAAHSSRSSTSRGSASCCRGPLAPGGDAALSPFPGTAVPSVAAVGSASASGARPDSRDEDGKTVRKADGGLGAPYSAPVRANGPKGCISSLAQTTLGARVLPFWTADENGSKHANRALGDRSPPLSLASAGIGGNGMQSAGGATPEFGDEDLRGGKGFQFVEQEGLPRAAPRLGECGRQAEADEPAAVARGATGAPGRERQAAAAGPLSGLSSLEDETTLPSHYIRRVAYAFSDSSGDEGPSGKDAETPILFCHYTSGAPTASSPSSAGGYRSLSQDEEGLGGLFPTAAGPRTRFRPSHPRSPACATTADSLPAAESPARAVVLRIPVCALCGYDAFCRGGGPARKTDKRGVWTHLRCALSLNATVTDRVSYEADESRSRLRCLFCHHQGPAPGQCGHAGCQRTYHVSCATATPGCMVDWDMGRPVIFCSQHAKNKAPTLILRKFQANREREAVKRREEDLPGEWRFGPGKGHLGVALQSLLFPNYDGVCGMFSDLLGVSSLQLPGAPSATTTTTDTRTPHALEGALARPCPHTASAQRREDSAIRDARLQQPRQSEAAPRNSKTREAEASRGKVDRAEGGGEAPQSRNFQAHSGEDVATMGDGEGVTPPAVAPPAGLEKDADDEDEVAFSRVSSVRRRRRVDDSEVDEVMEAPVEKTQDDKARGKTQACAQATGALASATAVAPSASRASEDESAEEEEGTGKSAAGSGGETSTNEVCMQDSRSGGRREDENEAEELQHAGDLRPSGAPHYGVAASSAAEEKNGCVSPRGEAPASCAVEANQSGGEGQVREGDKAARSGCRSDTDSQNARDAPAAVPGAPSGEHQRDSEAREGLEEREKRAADESNRPRVPAGVNEERSTTGPREMPPQRPEMEASLPASLKRGDAPDGRRERSDRANAVGSLSVEREAETGSVAPSGRSVSEACEERNAPRLEIEESSQHNCFSERSRDWERDRDGAESERKARKDDGGAEEDDARKRASRPRVSASVEARRSDDDACKAEEDVVVQLERDEDEERATALLWRLRAKGGSSGTLKGASLSHLARDSRAADLMRTPASRSDLKKHSESRALSSAAGTETPETQQSDARLRGQERSSSQADETQRSHQKVKSDADTPSDARPPVQSKPAASSSQSCLDSEVPASSYLRPPAGVYRQAVCFPSSFAASFSPPPSPYYEAGVWDRQQEKRAHPPPPLRSSPASREETAQSASQASAASRAPETAASGSISGATGATGVSGATGADASGAPPPHRKRRGRPPLARRSQGVTHQDLSSNRASDKERPSSSCVSYSRAAPGGAAPSSAAQDVGGGGRGGAPELVSTLSEEFVSSPFSPRGLHGSLCSVGSPSSEKRRLGRHFGPGRPTPLHLPDRGPGGRFLPRAQREKLAALYSAGAAGVPLAEGERPAAPSPSDAAQNAKASESLAADRRPAAVEPTAQRGGDEPDEETRELQARDEAMHQQRLRQVHTLCHLQSLAKERHRQLFGNDFALTGLLLGAPEAATLQGAFLPPSPAHGAGSPANCFAVKKVSGVIAERGAQLLASPRQTVEPVGAPGAESARSGARGDGGGAKETAASGLGGLAASESPSAKEGDQANKERGTAESSVGQEGEDAEGKEAFGAAGSAEAGNARAGASPSATSESPQEVGCRVASTECASGSLLAEEALAISSVASFSSPVDYLRLTTIKDWGLPQFTGDEKLFKCAFEDSKAAEVVGAETYDLFLARQGVQKEARLLDAVVDLLLFFSLRGACCAGPSPALLAFLAEGDHGASSLRGLAGLSLALGSGGGVSVAAPFGDREKRKRDEADRRRVWELAADDPEDGDKAEAATRGAEEDEPPRGSNSFFTKFCDWQEPMRALVDAVRQLGRDAEIDCRASVEDEAAKEDEEAQGGEAARRPLSKAEPLKPQCRRGSQEEDGKWRTTSPTCTFLERVRHFNKQQEDYIMVCSLCGSLGRHSRAAKSGAFANAVPDSPSGSGETPSAPAFASSSRNSAVAVVDLLTCRCCNVRVCRSCWNLTGRDAPPSFAVSSYLSSPKAGAHAAGLGTPNFPHGSRAAPTSLNSEAAARAGRLQRRRAWKATEKDEADEKADGEGGVLSLLGGKRERGEKAEDCGSGRDDREDEDEDEEREDRERHSRAERRRDAHAEDAEAPSVQEAKDDEDEGEEDDGTEDQKRTRAWRSEERGASMATRRRQLASVDREQPKKEERSQIDEDAEWTCLRCEAVLNARVPFRETRCILCSRIDGLLVRRIPEDTPVVTGSRKAGGGATGGASYGGPSSGRQSSQNTAHAHPADPPPERKEEQWVHWLCAEWLVPSRLASTASENIRSIPKLAFEKTCLYCGIQQGATLACCSNGFRCSASFHVSCARQLGCRMETQRRSLDQQIHRAYCLEHTTQINRKLMQQRLASLKPLSLQQRKDTWDLNRFFDPLQLLIADPVRAVTSLFVVGIQLDRAPPPSLSSFSAFVSTASLKLAGDRRRGWPSLSRVDGVAKADRERAPGKEDVDVLRGGAKKAGRCVGDESRLKRDSCEAALGRREEREGFAARRDSEDDEDAAALHGVRERKKKRRHETGEGRRAREGGDLERPAADGEGTNSPTTASVLTPGPPSPMHLEEQRELYCAGVAICDALYEQGRAFEDEALHLPPVSAAEAEAAREAYRVSDLPSPETLERRRLLQASALSGAFALTDALLADDDENETTTAGRTSRGNTVPTMSLESGAKRLRLSMSASASSFAGDSVSASAKERGGAGAGLSGSLPTRSGLRSSLAAASLAHAALLGEAPAGGPGRAHAANGDPLTPLGDCQKRMIDPAHLTWSPQESFRNPVVSLARLGPDSGAALSPEEAGGEPLPEPALTLSTDSEAEPPTSEGRGGARSDSPEGAGAPAGAPAPSGESLVELCARQSLPTLPPFLLRGRSTAARPLVGGATAAASASAMLASQSWYGGISAAASMAVAQAVQAVSGEGAGAQGGEANGEAEEAGKGEEALLDALTTRLQIGQPGQAQGEKQPIFCPICKGMYNELPDGGPRDGFAWVGCDCCERWYHWTCSGFNEENPPPDDCDWICWFCTIKIRKKEERERERQTQRLQAKEKNRSGVNTSRSRQLPRKRDRS
ncbi:hypothetical protein BESB_062490 [Besnoitia besnoiti]|uniref:PHD-finger domain-containing protein n=1 Tax=Besnoitia besnoiti TaxID=94643 RepID=A0A2A9MJ05_BESBE|nr:hypothetical protein BESB_062490 [Besnoitia besnoiti]PFH35362.1 hypothetical protein BESB_062490 [Besnoitia besnoiti]